MRVRLAVGAVAIVTLSYVSYSHFFGSSAGTTKTILAKASVGSVISRVTGSGQVAAISQTDVTSNVSGDISYVAVVPGQEVVLGQALVSIDDKDAVKAVRNAELAVANAQIAYDKALKQNANQATGSSVSDLKKAHEKGYDAITNTFIDLPAMFIDVSDMFYVPQHSPYFSDTEIRSGSGGELALTYKYQAGILFDKAKKEYDDSFAGYKSLSANSDPASLSAFLDRTYALLRTLSASLTGTYSTIDYINTRISSTPPAQIAADKAQLSSYISKVNANVASVSNAITAIEDAKDSAASSELSLKSAELTLSQQKDALVEAQTALADHAVRAPFAGIISKVVAEARNKAMVNGSMVTVITKSQNVTLSFNEIDAAKIKKGQKATLSFDAIDGLVLSGTVTDLDVVGTVSQGVVSYGAKISFDTNDARIKPGMTVSAAIIADSRDGVIVVPSSVIQSKGARTFVNTPAGAVTVMTGLSSDDKTEIVSGLREGDQYIASVVSSGAAPAAKTAASSLFGGAGAGRTGGTSTTRSTGAAMRSLGQ
jgi:multidrug efflux pump subunit AcrA (membrane-fusion protein)